MLPTFVIGLREGLEAALIVGIIAAFLRTQGRRDLLRWVFIGVSAAVVLCLAVGIVLRVVSHDLPQRQQEGLETVVGVLAVAMVTYMCVWMRRHSRELKGQLEGLAAGAISDGGSRAGRAMVLMAFLAVLREGFETVVFLLAAFNESHSGVSAPIGALLGITVAVAMGYAIYRGGLRLNLSRFFRVTGVVLVFVAAGLVLNALHTAHEAGWLNAGQSSTIDLSWLVRPGSIQSSLLTGMLGIQPHPVLIEVIGWLVYLVPVGVYVAWPPGRAIHRRPLFRTVAAAGAVCVAASIVFVVTAPGPVPSVWTGAGGIYATAVLSRSGDDAVVRVIPPPTTGEAARSALQVQVHGSHSETLSGVLADVFTASTTGLVTDSEPQTMSYQEISQLNGGRLPIGVQSSSAGTAQVRFRDADTLTVWLASATGRVLDAQWTVLGTASVLDPQLGEIALSKPVQNSVSSWPAAAVAQATAAERHRASQADRSALFSALAWSFGVLGVLLLLAGASGEVTSRRRTEPVAATPEAVLVGR